MPLNHADLAAVILRPWVPGSYHRMVQNHAVFQGYYFWHHIGPDRDARDALAEHPDYKLTEEFVRLYALPSFDPAHSAPRALRHASGLSSSKNDGASQPEAEDHWEGARRPGVSTANPRAPQKTAQKRFHIPLVIRPHSLTEGTPAGVYG